MESRRFASTALLTLGLCSLASLFGCSSSSSAANTPPVVDALEVPATATVGASGNYEIKGTISAHDPDGVIHQILVEIPGFTTPAIAIDQQTLVSREFLLQIDGRSPKGPLTATAKIIDDQGGTTSKAVTITLQ